MAGLQYKFFPTDFFFPVQKTVSGDNISKQNILIKTRNSDESLIDDSKSQGKIVISSNKTLKAISSSSLAFAPTQNRRKIKI
ncbi:hypothetical protein RND71_004265 [Anisodus tanguticus]|uniref:Uncharacterized protein n=1 Tax=Anisodus tanguticus TaxID=243964 RepID=A0AAE1SW69_9SOLA|nr:hypothetical protein RND71_004265 [Anisodus tanguticus]